MYRYIKRALDFISALLLLIAISPLFFILMIIVRAKLGSPIFFKQQRAGLHQKPFQMIKFRSMTDERDENGNLLPDEKRTGGFSRRFRSLSLDELPELISIIRGDMSVIGPRPLPMSCNDYYTEREKKRFEVRGGLIPPDSVAGSLVTSWDEQLEYEAAYAENLCFKNDLKIFLSVFKILFKRCEDEHGSYFRKELDEERSRENKNAELNRIG